MTATQFGLAFNAADEYPPVSRTEAVRIADLYANHVWTATERNLYRGLDPKGVRLLKDILFGLKEEGTSIILSTHIIAIAEQICDEIAIINKGCVIAKGTNQDLRHFALSDDKDLEDIFLRLTSDYKQSEAGS